MHKNLLGALSKATPVDRMRTTMTRDCIKPEKNRGEESTFVAIKLNKCNSTPNFYWSVNPAVTPACWQCNNDEAVRRNGVKLRGTASGC